MKILAIGAHSDDAELACGGTLAKAIAAGHEAHMLVLTKSNYPNLEGTEIRSPKEARDEAVAAAAALGLAEDRVQLLSYKTLDLPYNSSTVADIEKVMNDFGADVILTHWPFDTHQDHRRAALSTISAGRHYNSILMYEPIFPSGRSYIGFRPQIYVDISDRIEQKLNALRCHRTQYEKYGDDWIAAIESRCRLRGYEIGCKYAEAFEVARFEWNLDAR